jgi:hypothetical protein
MSLFLIMFMRDNGKNLIKLVEANKDAEDIIG